MKLDEVELQRLFGHEAAEDEDPERLREYYFKNKVYNSVVNDLPLRIIVGHKGIGKSALFQVAMHEEQINNRLTILIKPDDIIGIGQSTDDFLKLIREWKKGINEIIARKVLTSFGSMDDGWKSKLSNFGGNALDFLSSTLRVENHADLSDTKNAILKNFLLENKISVYIDDLDRGWQGRRSDIQKISALLNAIRDISTDSRGILFRISLRSDVYYLARTSDESTDKTESSVIWFAWTNHEILVLLVKRIESYFGREVDEELLLNKHQSELMAYLTPIMEKKFDGVGHWKDAPMYRILMSLTRKRPRDLVKLLTLAGRSARQHNGEIITSKDFKSIFEEYSQGRLQDTINEYRSELPQIEKLIFGMKPSKIQQKTAQNYVYSTDELLKKIKSILEQGSLKWANGSDAEPRELIAFLYKINFITARKEESYGIDRKYFEENRYLSNSFNEFGYDWEVHPAYRWALQPSKTIDIFKDLQLSSN